MWSSLKIKWVSLDFSFCMFKGFPKPPSDLVTQKDCQNSLEDFILMVMVYYREKDIDWNRPRKEEHRADPGEVSDADLLSSPHRVMMCHLLGINVWQYAESVAHPPRMLTWVFGVQSFYCGSVMCCSHGWLLVFSPFPLVFYFLFFK